MSKQTNKGNKDMKKISIEKEHLKHISGYKNRFLEIMFYELNKIIKRLNKFDKSN